MVVFQNTFFTYFTKLINNHLATALPEDMGQLWSFVNVFVSVAVVLFKCNKLDPGLPFCQLGYCIQLYGTETLHGLVTLLCTTVWYKNMALFSTAVVYNCMVQSHYIV